MQANHQTGTRAINSHALRIAVITVSDSRSSRENEDTVGPSVAARISAAGHEVAHTMIVPDELEVISRTLTDLCAPLGSHAGENGECVDVVFTTGGTGCSVRDVTPEATRAIGEVEIPGFGELFRREGAAKTPFSWLSRSTAVRRGQTIVINLPGSMNGALECLELSLPLVGHAVRMVGGGGHDS